MRKAAEFNPTSTTQGCFFKLRLLFECGLCATWVRRKCGFYSSAASNQVRLLYTTLRYVRVCPYVYTCVDCTGGEGGLHGQWARMMIASTIRLLAFFFLVPVQVQSTKFTCCVMFFSRWLNWWSEAIGRSINRSPWIRQASLAHSSKERQSCQRIAAIV